MLSNQTIAFLGAGSMAEAMIAGIIQAGNISSRQLIATNRSNENRLKELQTKYGIKAMKQEELDFDQIDILILAMKPKDMDEALRFLKQRIKSNHLVLSVAAGVSTIKLEKSLRESQQVIRVMPNTASMIGESATAISPGKYVSQEYIKAAKELFSQMGSVYMIEEDKMDIFTGIAGSGPAYFYYLMEYIEKAGKEEGLDHETVRKISAQTILGAARMIMENRAAPAQLREEVTSPNGTTAAGLEALKKHGGGLAIFQAVKGAASRSKELSVGFKSQFDQN